MHGVLTGLETDNNIVRKFILTGITRKYDRELAKLLHADFALARCGRSWFGTSSPSQSTAVCRTKRPSTRQTASSFSRLSLFVSEYARRSAHRRQLDVPRYQHNRLGRRAFSLLDQLFGTHFLMISQMRTKTLSGSH